MDPQKLKAVVVGLVTDANTISLESLGGATQRQLFTNIVWIQSNHVAGPDEGGKLSSIDGINYCYILKSFPQLITWLANTATSTNHLTSLGLVKMGEPHQDEQWVQLRDTHSENIGNWRGEGWHRGGSQVSLAWGTYQCSITWPSSRLHGHPPSSSDSMRNGQCTEDQHIIVVVFPAFPSLKPLQNLEEATRVTWLPDVNCCSTLAWQLNIFEFSS